MSSSGNVDAQALAARERWLLAVSRGDAAATLSASQEIMRVLEAGEGYELLRLVPRQSAAQAAAENRPREITSQFNGRCRKCSAVIAEGGRAIFTPGLKGVTCVKCGGGK